MQRKIEILAILLLFIGRHLFACEVPDTVVCDELSSLPYAYISDGSNTNIQIPDSVFYSCGTGVQFRVSQTRLNPDEPFLTDYVNRVLPLIRKSDLTLCKIIVRGDASPDGPLTLNQTISQKRTRELVDFIQRADSVTGQMIESESISEDYGYLLYLMKQGGDQEYEHVQAMFDLTHGDVRAMKDSLMSDIRLWNRLKKQYFHCLRSARLMLVFSSSQVKSEIPAEEIVADNVPAEEPVVEEAPKEETTIKETSNKKEVPVEKTIVDDNIVKPVESVAQPITLVPAEAEASSTSVDTDAVSSSKVASSDKQQFADNRHVDENDPSQDWFYKIIGLLLTILFVFMVGYFIWSQLSQLRKEKDMERSVSFMSKSDEDPKTESPSISVSETNAQQPPVHETVIPPSNDEPVDSATDKSVEPEEPSVEQVAESMTDKSVEPEEPSVEQVAESMTDKSVDPEEPSVEQVSESASDKSVDPEEPFVEQVSESASDKSVDPEEPSVEQVSESASDKSVESEDPSDELVAESTADNSVEQADVPVLSTMDRNFAIIAERLEEQCIRQYLYLDKTLTCAILAKKIGTNTRYLSNYLNHVLHMTFTEYINNLRLDLATDMLLNTDDPMEQISMMCGFAHMSRFHRAFQKKYNCSPGLYRQQKRAAANQS